MQSQKRATDGFGQKRNEETLKLKPLSVSVPDVHESMKLAGVKSVTPGRKDQRLICCCGVPGCGIGPMTKVET